ncbi:MAG: nonstructural protein [Microvirus sp.]|nr:MAG: nonstructural protein [Microvirus sp.]
MILQVVVIRDSAAAVYGQPQYVASIGSAIRGFGDEVNRSAADNSFFRHPEDFILYHVGTYSDDFAKFTLFDEPVQLARAVDLVVKVN